MFIFYITSFNSIAKKLYIATFQQGKILSNPKSDIKKLKIKDNLEHLRLHIIHFSYNTFDQFVHNIILGIKLVLCI